MKDGLRARRDFLATAARLLVGRAIYPEPSDVSLKRFELFDRQRAYPFPRMLTSRSNGALFHVFRCAALCLTMLSLVPAVSFCQAVSSISPTSATISGSGGIGTVSVTAPANVGWTAVSTTAWISVYSGITGSGGGYFSYSVSANLTQSARTGAISVGGQTFTVNEGAGVAPFPITWTPIGPHDIPGAPGDLQSGKLQALAIYYNNPNIMYTAGGRFLGPFNETGVFKTVDGGTSWVPVNSGLDDPIIDALWVDQTNPNLVLAGTDTEGIFKSSDGGQTWGLAANLGATSSFALSGTTLLAATAAGIAQSTDSGSTWSIVQPVSSGVSVVAATGGVAIAGTQNGTIMVRNSTNASWQNVYSNPPSGVVYLAIDSLDPRIMYAGYGGHNGVTVTVMTRDSGVTWSAINGPNGVSLGPLAMAPASHVLYATGPEYTSLYSTADGGQSWTTIPAAWDYRSIFTIPGQPTIILGSDQGLHKSNDNGKTWINLSGGIYASILSSVAVHGSTILAGAQDFTALASFDGGNSWKQVGGGENGPSVINPANPNYCYNYTASGYEYSADGCKSLHFVSVAELRGTGLGQTCCSDTIAVDPSNPAVVYAASQAGVFKSVDWGVTMTNTNWGWLPATVIAVSPLNSNTIYVGTAYPNPGVFRTQNGGSSWSPVSFAGASVLANTIAMSPKDPNIVLIGLSQQPAFGGGVLKSTDGGSTFHLANNGVSGAFLGQGGIQSLRFSPDGMVALATGGGVYISTDSGDHWQNANANAIPTYFSDVAWDRGYLYAATQGQGVLRTELPGNVHVTITSSTPGAAFSLEDGGTYFAPVTFSWAPGGQHTVTWLTAATGQSGTRYSFQSWADGGSNPRTITVPSAAATYTATIQVQYQLTITISPAAGGSISVSPASADGYYASGTNVTVTAAAASGYAFGYFSGDVAAGASPQTVPVTAPRSVTANFYPPPPPGALPGVLAYWAADNSTLDVVSGVSGTLVSGATFAAGKVNQAFSLNGVSSYVQAAGPAMASGPRTLAAWVFPNAGSGLGMPILTGGQTQAGDFFGITGTGGSCPGSGQYRLYVDHWYTPCFISANALAPNVWSHVAVTYDGATVQFYINGVASQTIPGSMYNYGVSTYEIGGNTIGGSSTKASFNGLLDEIQVYGRALSQAEIQALYYRNLGGQPAVLSTQPVSGNTNSQTFTVQFSHTSGYQALSVVNILVNNYLDGRHACYLAYAQPSNILYLVNDAGDAGGPYAGSVALGNPGTIIQNSQCAVSLASATGSGATLTLVLNINLNAVFGGNRIQYLAARDGAGGNTGWQAMGVWQVQPGPSGPITLGSASPTHGAAPAGTQQQLTFALTDSKGVGDLGVVNVLVNNFIDGRNACYLAYVASNNSLLLVDDAGDAGGPFSGSMLLNGSTGAIQNSQCSVRATGSSAVVNGNMLALTLNITFKSALQGNRVVWVAGRDSAGANNTDWQAMATWAVQ